MSGILFDASTGALMSLVAKRLEELGVKVPPQAAPVANYVAISTAFALGKS